MLLNRPVMKTTLSSAAILLGSLALTACQPGSTTASAGATPSQSSSVAGTSSTDPASGGAAPVSAPSTGKGSSVGSGTSAGTSGSGGSADSDSYAYTHPCSGRQVSLHVTRRDGAPSQRVIVVRNIGAHACGLSYFPQVYLDNAHASGGRIVKPMIPSGLGGAPAYPVHAGQTAYAVIDLDPSGATTGTVSGIDELNVLADGDHMPNAETRNFQLGSGALVLKPKLGLYRSTVADAVTSMTGADTQS
ncbi:hypothetical protein ABIA32_000049 [Streptacidiphilus sp. MAP12-20]|uniref:DUF4232 domain-containing protein n=1 Tax=Streptacidiphilus sp. MAP12-20 TaxID=3156299 RepID=UPI0035133BC8